MRVYKRKTDRQNWSEENMKKAIEMALRKEKCIRSISILYNLPKSTLMDRIKQIKKGFTIAEAAKKGLGRLKTVFNFEEERQLVELMKETQSLNPTQKDLRRIAFNFAEKHKIPHRFNTKEGLAGSDWLQGFFDRHPDFSSKSKQTKTKDNQTIKMEINHLEVKQFFVELQKIMDNYKFEASNIYNADEIGLITDTKGSRLIALKENTLSLAEHDKLVTAVVCYSGTCMFVPPKLNICSGYKTNSTPNTWTQMQSDSFVDWMKLFTKHIQPSKNDPVLLLLNNIYINKSIENFSHENGVVLLGIPSEFTQKLQPLDISFMGSLHNYYTMEVKTWMREHPGKALISVQMCSMFGAAYCKAREMAINTMDSGFETSGVIPLNPNLFLREPTQSTSFHENANNISETFDIDS